MPTAYSIYYTYNDLNNTGAARLFGTYSLSGSDWVRSSESSYYTTKAIYLSSISDFLDCGEYKFWIEVNSNDYYSTASTKETPCLLTVTQSTPSYRSLKSTSFTVGDDYSDIDFNDIFFTYVERGGKEEEISGTWTWVNKPSSTLVNSNKSYMYQLTFTPDLVHSSRLQTDVQNYKSLSVFYTVSSSLSELDGNLEFTNASGCVNGVYQYYKSDTPIISLKFTPTSEYFEALSSIPETLTFKIKIGSSSYVTTTLTRADIADSSGNTKFYYVGSVYYSKPLSVGIQNVSYEITATSYTAKTTAVIENAVQIFTYKPECEILPNAADITYGESLSASTISGGKVVYTNSSGSTVEIAGTYSFEDASRVLPAGTYSMPVIFTPTDSGTYAAVRIYDEDNDTGVNISVEPADPKLTTSSETYYRTNYNEFDVGVQHLSDGELIIENISNDSLINVEVVNFNETAIIKPVQPNVKGRASVTMYTAATENYAESEHITITVIYDKVDWAVVDWNYPDASSKDNQLYTFQCTASLTNFTDKVKLSNLPTGYTASYTYTKSEDGGVTYNTASSINGYGMYKVTANIISSDTDTYEQPSDSEAVHITTVKVLPYEYPIYLDVDWSKVRFTKDRYIYKEVIPIKEVQYPTLKGLPELFEYAYDVNYSIVNSNDNASPLYSISEHSPYTVTATITSKGVSPDPGQEGIKTCLVYFQDEAPYPDYDIVEQNPSDPSDDGTNPSDPVDPPKDPSEDPEEIPDSDDIDWSIVGFSDDNIVYTFNGKNRYPVIQHLNNHYSVVYSYTDADGNDVGAIRNVGEYTVTAVLSTSNSYRYPIPDGYKTFSANVTVNKKDINYDWSKVRFGSHDSKGYEAYYSSSGYVYSLKNLPKEGYKAYYRITDKYENVTVTYDDIILTEIGQYRIDAIIETDPNYVEAPKEYQSYHTMVTIYSYKPEQTPEDWKNVKFSSSEYTLKYDGTNKYVELLYIPDGYTVNYSYVSWNGDSSTTVNAMRDIGDYYIYAYIIANSEDYTVPEGYGIISALVHIVKDSDDGDTDPDTDIPDPLWGNTGFSNKQYEILITDANIESKITAIKLSNVPTSYEESIVYKYYQGTKAINITYMTSNAGKYQVTATINGAPDAYKYYSADILVTNPNEKISDVWKNVSWELDSPHTFTYDGIGHSVELVNLPNNYVVSYEYIDIASGKMISTSHAADIGSYKIVASIKGRTTAIAESPSSYKTLYFYFTIKDEASSGDSGNDDTVNTDPSPSTMWNGAMFSNYRYTFIYDGVTNFFDNITYSVPDGYNVIYTVKDSGGNIIDDNVITAVGTYFVTSFVEPIDDTYAEPPAQYKTDSTKVIVTNKYMSDDSYKIWGLIDFNIRNAVFPVSDIKEVYLENIPDGYYAEYTYTDIGGNEIREIDINKEGVYYIIGKLYSYSASDEIPSGYDTYKTTISVVSDDNYINDDDNVFIDWSSVRFTSNSYKYEYKEGTKRTPVLIGVPLGYSYTLKYEVYNKDTGLFESASCANKVGLYKVTSKVYGLDSNEVPTTFVNPTATLIIYDPDDNDIVFDDEVEFDWSTVGFRKTVFQEYNDGTVKAPELLNVPKGYSVTYRDTDSSGNVLENGIYDTGVYTRIATITRTSSIAEPIPVGRDIYNCTIIVKDYDIAVDDNWENVGFANDTYSFIYDINTIYNNKVKLSNVPKGYTVYYAYYKDSETVNYLFESGTYIVEAYIENAPANYSHFTAKVVISESEPVIPDIWKNVGFTKSKYIITYDGLDHNIALRNIPEGYDVVYTYTLNGEDRDSINAVGSYKVTAALTPQEGYSDIPDGKDVYTAIVEVRNENDSSGSEITSTNPIPGGKPEISGDDDNGDSDDEGDTGNDSDNPNAGKTVWSKVKFEKSRYTIDYGSTFNSAKLINLPKGYSAVYSYAYVGDINNYTKFDNVPGEGIKQSGNYILKAEIERNDTQYGLVPDTYKEIFAEGIVDNEYPVAVPTYWKYVGFSQNRYNFKYDGNNHISEVILENVPNGYGVSYNYYKTGSDGDVSTYSITDAGSYKAVAQIVAQDSSNTVPSNYEYHTAFVKVIDSNIVDITDTEITDDWSKVAFKYSTYNKTYTGDAFNDIVLNYIVDGNYAVYKAFRVVNGSYQAVDEIRDIGTYKVYAYVYNTETDEMPEDYNIQTAAVYVREQTSEVNEWDYVKWSSNSYVFTYDGEAHLPLLKNIPEGHYASYSYYCVDNEEYVDEPIEVGTYYVTARIVTVVGFEEPDDMYSLYSTTLVINKKDNSGSGDDNPSDPSPVYPDGYEWLSNVGFDKSVYKFPFDGKTDYKDKVVLQGVPDDFEGKIEYKYYFGGATYSHLTIAGTFSVTATVIPSGDDASLEFNGRNIFKTKAVIYEGDEPEDITPEWEAVKFNKKDPVTYTYDGSVHTIPKLINVPDKVDVAYNIYNSGTSVMVDNLVDIGTYEVRATLSSSTANIPEECLIYSITVVIKEAANSEETTKPSDEPNPDFSTVTTESSTEGTTESETGNIDDPVTETTTNEKPLTGEWSNVAWVYGGGKFTYTGKEISSPYLNGIPNGYDVYYECYESNDTDLVNKVSFKNIGDYQIIGYVYRTSDKYEMPPRTRFKTTASIVLKSDSEDSLLPKDESVLNYIKFSKSQYSFEYTGNEIIRPSLLNVPYGGYNVEYRLYKTSEEGGPKVSRLFEVGTYDLYAYVTAKPGWRSTPYEVYQCTIKIIDPEGTSNNPDEFDDPSNQDKDPNPGEKYDPPNTSTYLPGGVII